jgi:stage III sporulation protein SpoIIIAA
MTEDRELTPISVRVDKKQLERLKKRLGLTDNSKAIRAAMNCAVNVTHNLFGNEVQDIFKRRKDNEEVELYDLNL